MEAMADMSYREAKHPEGDPEVNSTCHIGDSRSVVSSSETVFPRCEFINHCSAPGSSYLGVGDGCHYG